MSDERIVTTVRLIPQCLLAEERGELLVWLGGFSMVIRIPQFGSVCIYIHIYISFCLAQGQMSAF